MSNKNISNCDKGIEYKIAKIATANKEMENFLFTLGCYEGETVTLVSVISGNYVVTIKDSRYSIDKKLAEAIVLEN